MKIKILGKVVDVRDAREGELEMYDCIGCALFNESTIIMDQRLSDEEYRETLLHEIMHFCDVKTSANGDRLTESQNTRMSAVLFDALDRNKKLARFILGVK